MERLMAKNMFGWARAIAAGVAAVVGVYSSYNEEKVAGLDSSVWLRLSVLYCLSVIMHLLAKILVKMKAKEES